MLQRIQRNDLPTFWANPFREMERFFADDFFSPLFSNGTARFHRESWLPAMDVKEDEEAYLATFDLPGLSKDDVEITVDDNVLTVSGERKWESEDDEADESKGRYHRVERSYGKFTRSFTLPRTVRATDVKAEFKDGVLHLTLPKSEEAKARRIDIS